MTGSAGPETPGSGPLREAQTASSVVLRPEEVKLQEQLSFLAGALPRPPVRILDAGCGRGALAARLLLLGYQVVGVDHNPDAVSAAQAAGVSAVECDFTAYQDGLFDVVVFSASLHHILPLDVALDRTVALLRPGGVLIADEYVAEQADRSTATWYYDTVALLAAAGVLTPGEQLPPPGDPVARWRLQHEHERRNSGDDMLAEIRRRFQMRTVEQVPCLYRYLAEWLQDSERGYRVAAELLSIEQHRLADSSLAPMGLRVVATSTA